MAFSVEHKHVIITGGTSGLGLGVARGFHQHGARVLVMGRTDKAQSVQAAEGFAHAIQVDLGNREELKKAYAQAEEALDGQVDVLINCAGIQRRHECEDFPMSDWDEVLEVNLSATFELCQLAGRCMLRQGHGKIINFASMLSFFGGLRVPAYAASKGGVMQLTRALAVAWASKGIQVNAIAPGYMATEMNTALLADEARSAAILSRIPAGRWGTPEDVLGPCLFLASDASDYVTGAILPVDGGYLSC